MNIATYEKLTGVTLTDAEKPAITAQLRRTKAMLESMLGYSLSKEVENQYEEKGKATGDFGLCGFLGDINDANLEAKDEVIGSYRLFPYEAADPYFVVDPFTKVHAVKLVFVKMGEDPTGITHKTFDDNKVRISKGGKVSKYIERCPECWCTCRCEKSCVQLAVDADWLNEDCLPDELAYIWADMVGYEVDCKKDIKSETLGTHSYTKFDRKRPSDMPENITILRKYAGPNGSLAVTVTV